MDNPLPLETEVEEEVALTAASVVDPPSSESEGLAGRKGKKKFFGTSRLSRRGGSKAKRAATATASVEQQGAEEEEDEEGFSPAVVGADGIAAALVAGGTPSRLRPGDLTAVDGAAEAQAAFLVKRSSVASGQFDAVSGASGRPASAPGRGATKVSYSKILLQYLIEVLTYSTLFQSGSFLKQQQQPKSQNVFSSGLAALSPATLFTALMFALLAFLMCSSVYLVYRVHQLQVQVGESAHFNVKECFDQFLPFRLRLATPTRCGWPILVSCWIRSRLRGSGKSSTSTWTKYLRFVMPILSQTIIKF